MSDDAKSIGLGRELLDYVVAHSGGPDPIATQLADTTRSAFGDAALMNVEQDQGRFLEFLVALTGARTVVEIGTFTGMSALFLARGLGPGGRLICLEREERFVEIGREFWRQAGVEERIEVRIGPAAEALAALEPDVRIDLAFIDADKGGYAEYLDLVLARLSPSGFVAVDNVLWGGAVVDAHDDAPDTEAIRRFNDRVRDDPSLDVVMLSVGDGISLIRRRSPG